MEATDKRKCLEASNEPEAKTKTAGGDLAAALQHEVHYPVESAVRWAVWL
jgi:hypothetical protein